MWSLGVEELIDFWFGAHRQHTAGLVACRGLNTVMCYTKCFFITYMSLQGVIPAKKVFESI